MKYHGKIVSGQIKTSVFKVFSSFIFLYISEEVSQGDTKENTEGNSDWPVDYNMAEFLATNGDNQESC